MTTADQALITCDPPLTEEPENCGTCWTWALLSARSSASLSLARRPSVWAGSLQWVDLFSSCNLLSWMSFDRYVCLAVGKFLWFLYMSALSYLILPWFVLSWQVGNWEHSAIIPTRKYGRRRRILDHKRQENSASRLYFIGIHHRKERENSGNWKESRYDLLDVKSEGKKSYLLYVTISKWSLHRVNRQSCLFKQKKEKKSEKALFLQAGSNQWSKEILRDSESFFILRTVALIAWSPHISLRWYQIYAQDRLDGMLKNFGIEMKISRLYFAIPDSEGKVSWNHGPRSMVA